jgi:hypothetical protein
VPTPGSKAKRGDAEEKGTGEVIGEIWQLVKDYAKQETVDPLLRLKRVVLFGVPGALLGGFGVFFLVLGLLRALQTQTGPHLTGHLSWVPYVVTLIATVVAAALAIWAIGRPNRVAKKQA